MKAYKLTVGTHMDKSLPIVKVPYARYNPDFIPVLGPDCKTANMHEQRLPSEMLDAEVLTLNLNTGNMRVRFVEPQFNPSRGKAEVVSIDTSVIHFFNTHKIEKV